MNRLERLKFDPDFVDKSSKAQKWYGKKLSEFIRQIGFRKNFRSYLAPVLGGRVKLTKHQARKILDAISQNYAFELCDFFNQEASTGRFTPEEFVGWFDRMIHSRRIVHDSKVC